MLDVVVAKIPSKSCRSRRVSQAFSGREERIGKEKSGGQGHEGHDGSASALAGDDGFAGDPFIEDGVDLTSGNKHDDAASH